MSVSRVTVGLALGSGGAKGLAHIGVIKTLEKYDIPIDFIAGSSIGALVGAYYSSHKDSKSLEDIALGFNKRKGFSLFDLSFRGGFIKGKKIESFIGELLDKESFDKLSIPFSAVATDFITAEPVIIDSGNLRQAVRASISVPSFFQSVSYQGRLLADGGLSNPVPVEVVRKMGADIVIAVNLDNSYIEDHESNDTGLSLAEIPLYSVNILRYHLALHSAKTADLIIIPNVYLRGIIGWNDFFDTARAKEIIKVGEEATEKIIPDLQKLILERQSGKIVRGFIPQLSALFKRIKIS
jgi:NTE family protein